MYELRPWLTEYLLCASHSTHSARHISSPQGNPFPSLTTSGLWLCVTITHHCLNRAGCNQKVPAAFTFLDRHCHCTKSGARPCLDVRLEHAFPAFLAKGFKEACLSLDRNPTGPDLSYFMAKNTSLHMVSLDCCSLGCLGLGTRQPGSLGVVHKEEEVLAQGKPHLPS